MVGFHGKSLFFCGSELQIGSHGLPVQGNIHGCAIARRKYLCKLDGPRRGVDGARCRSPEESL